MKYEDIFARSFTRHDGKRLKFSALVGCFIATWYLCTVFKPYLGPLPMSYLRLTSDETIESQRPYVEIKETKLICDTSNKRSDICEMNGDVRIQGNSSTIFVYSSHIENISWTIQPYARKSDRRAMGKVTKFTIKSIQDQHAKMMPKCTQSHNEPAIVFSVAGYATNNFHAFIEIIIPLYAASREFKGEVRFLMANKRSQWTRKFQGILENLSSYEIIDIDQENEVHCFKSMIVGLRSQEKLQMDLMKDFRSFLRSTYSLEKSTILKLTNGVTKRPRLLIISRKKTRAFKNEKDVVRVAQESGFEVIMTELNANLTLVSRLINSCDVLMGVHGAGLTNMVFLPENGVLIQVVPWGNMAWIAKTYFEEPSKAMGLKYLEYKISEKESTLIEQYPLDHEVFKDPVSFLRKGWGVSKTFYLYKQNVTLDVVRFKETLSKALQLLHE